MLIICVLLSLSMGFADKEVDEQLPNVQRDMSAPGFSKEAEKMSPDAKKSIENMRALSGNDPQTEQAMMQLAADIMGNMKGKSMDQIKAEMQNAQRNPTAFANTLTPEQLNKLKEISRRIESQKVSSPPPK